MRVALLSCNAQARNAIGNQVAEKLGFFRERGAEVRVFLQCVERLHLNLRGYAQQVSQVVRHGSVWDYLATADLVVADYAQTYELLHYLPLLVGEKPRLVFEYHGVTPAQYWEGAQRVLLERSARDRGLVWCADVALAHSRFAKEELERATGYPAERIVVLPYPTDLKQFLANHDAQPLRMTRFAPGPVLLYVGRLAVSKRVSLLIEALPQVPGAQAKIVGDVSDVYAKEVNKCRELAVHLDVSDRVHFLGQVDDVELADLYRTADVLVIPSLHEGYCLPAIEAMASGLPVVAARTTALPETLGDAGLSFTPDDAQDLARKVNLALGTGPRELNRPPTGRIAIVAFRFGSAIVGGAETSLRTIARSLQDGGLQVDVYTTCTLAEGDWANHLTPGTFTLDGFTIHRFPIDAHDREAHHASIAAIRAGDGRVDRAAELAYLRHSIHSTPLIDALRSRRTEYDAIITGPYLFGLTHDVAQAFAEQTLLLPCFHDEPYARLNCWLETYGAVGGILYHSPEEQEFGECTLGLNHPRAIQIGTTLDVSASSKSPVREQTRRTIVYCGRYSQQKNLPLLLEYAGRYELERPGRFQFEFLGQGEVRIPQAAWATDRGRVEEEAKRQTMAHAAALVQLSRQESLSLVALEAWAQATPIIVHADCAVLCGQVARANGGRAIGDYDGFAQALDDLWERPDAWQALGANGREYVVAQYGSAAAYRRRLLQAIDNLRIPWRDCMQQRGRVRAADRDRPRWRERFGDFVERVLDSGAPARIWHVEVQSRANVCRGALGQRSTLIAARVANRGTLPALADGPAQTVLIAEVVDSATGKRLGTPSRTPLPFLILPGKIQPAALAVTLPAEPGEYQLVLRAESDMGTCEATPQHILPLFVGVPAPAPAQAGAGDFLEAIQASLAEVQRLQKLPDDYLDVTEGRFARWKRWLKQKLLGNFKKGYVDVLSRQQSQVNQHLLLAVQQLAEHCATLEHAISGLRDRSDAGSQQLPSSTISGVEDAKNAEQSWF